MIIDRIKEGKTNEALEELRNNPTACREKDESGLTAIIWAAYYRNETVLKFIASSYPGPISVFECCALADLTRLEQLIQEDPALLSEYSPDGFQALGLSTFFGHVPLVQYLVEVGADVNTPSNNDFMVRPIHSAVAANSLESVRILIAAGADLNAAQQKGIRPIHSASHLGNAEILRALLENGAIKTLQSDDGRRAVDYAAENENEEEILKILTAYP